MQIFLSLKYGFTNSFPAQNYLLHVASNAKFQLNHSITDLIVQVSMDSHFRFSLETEEGIVQLLVVNVDFAKLGSYFFSHFGFQILLFFLQSDPCEIINISLSVSLIQVT